MLADYDGVPQPLCGRPAVLALMESGLITSLEI